MQFAVIYLRARQLVQGFFQSILFMYLFIIFLRIKKISAETIILWKIIVIEPYSKLLIC